MFGSSSNQTWNFGDDIEFDRNLCDDAIDDVDSDSSEYRRELEEALYCQIHHETVGDSSGAIFYSVEDAEEINSEIIRSESPKIVGRKAHPISHISDEIDVSLEKPQVQPKATSTPALRSEKLKSERKKKKIKLKRNTDPQLDIKEFLISSSCEPTSSSNPKKSLKVVPDKNKTPEVLTVSSDFESDTDVAVKQHLVAGVSVTGSKKRKWKEHKQDLIDLTRGNSSSSDSDVLQDIGDSKTDVNIVLNIDNRGGQKIVLNAADLSDYEELCKLDEDSTWNIIDTDKYSFKTPGRYYGLPKIECNNCKERGHLSRDCPKPKKLPACLQCGIRGHMFRKCPGSLCNNCNEPGHISRNCMKKFTRVTDQCYRCSGTGHRKSDCSDLWRQYHLTTRPGMLVHAQENQENTKMYCFNCAEEGHFGHECTRDMMNHWSKEPFCPWVTRYDPIIIRKSTSSSKKRDRDEYVPDQPVEKKRKTLLDSPVRSKSISKHAKGWLASQDKPSKKKKKEKNTKWKGQRFEERYGGEDLPRSTFDSRKRPNEKRKNERTIESIYYDGDRSQGRKGAGNSSVGQRKSTRFDDDDDNVQKTKKKGKKNFKEKKAALAAQFATEQGGDTCSVYGKGKKDKKWTNKNDPGCSHFKSKWVPSEKGTWTYKGKGKKGQGASGYSAAGKGSKAGQSKKGYQSKKGFNFNIY